MWLLQTPHNFLAKNITEIDFVSTVVPNQSSTIDFVMLTMLFFKTNNIVGL